MCPAPLTNYTLQGDFDLLPMVRSSFEHSYSLSNIRFRAVGTNGVHYQISGGGSWSIPSVFPPLPSLTVTLRFDDGTTNKPYTFTSHSTMGYPLSPMISFGGSQFDGTPLHKFSFSASCAPVQEIWFSTRRAMTSSGSSFDPPRLDPGDVLSDAGHVVRRSAELLRPFGIVPSTNVSPPEVDALGVALGGEIVFSLRQDVLSPTVGLLAHGDLLSSNGRIVKRNQELLQAFGVAPGGPDAGLDGVEVFDTGEISFSITTNVFSEKLGVMLTAGDLLSSQGLITRTHQQLIANFLPNPPDGEFGLTGFHQWPGINEIWFSVEKGFDSARGLILPGDLLSSLGYVVVHNSEFVSKFAPVENLADFGLGGLFVITEPFAIARRPTVALPERLASGVRVHWDNSGRLFQLERAPAVVGDYVPVSPIITAVEFLDLDAAVPNAFYRVRIW